MMRWWSLSPFDRENTQNELDNSEIFANEKKRCPNKNSPNGFLSYKIPNHKISKFPNNS